MTAIFQPAARTRALATWAAVPEPIITRSYVFAIWSPSKRELQAGTRAAYIAASSQKGSDLLRPHRLLSWRVLSQTLRMLATTKPAFPRTQRRGLAQTRETRPLSRAC